MITFYWIVAGLAALVFAAAGGMKLARPRAALQASGMGWVEDFNPGSVKLVGALEVLGALGLILPALAGTAVVLSPVAGICLVLVMIGAVVVHIRRKEPFGAPGLLAVFAAVAAILGFIAL